MPSATALTRSSREANGYRNRSLSPSTEEHMPKILVIHGAGMNMRGKVQVDLFGPMTLPEYDERIRGYARELGVDVEIFHSNVEGEIVNRLYAANDQGFDAAIFNPAAFGTGYPALVAAISQVKFPTTERSEERRVGK